MEFVVSRICAPWPTTEAEKKFSATALQVVLCNWGLRYWEDVKTCLREAPETCQEALYDLSYFYRHGDADKLSSLEPWQLAELYVWLRNYRYQKKGTVSTEANSMEDYAYLTLDNYMIIVLCIFIFVL